MRLSTRTLNRPNPWACTTESCQSPSTRVWWDTYSDMMWPYCDQCANRLVKYFYDKSATIEEAKVMLIKERL